MSATPDGEALNSLFRLTAKIHEMATEEATSRLANHLAIGAQMGFTICKGVRVQKEGAYDGIMLIFVGPRVSTADADAFADYAKMMLQDVNPAAAASLSKNDPS